jgi:hypothetical protein
VIEEDIFEPLPLTSGSVRVMSTQGIFSVMKRAREDLSFVEGELRRRASFPRAAAEAQAP